MRKRIFIFEGMDNCLKDTLIKDLRATLSSDTHVLKYSNPPNVPNAEKYQREHFADMFNLIASTLSSSSRNLILNRSHLGEYIYAPIYRHYRGDWIFDLEKKFVLSSQLHDDLCLLILLFDSNNENLKLREDGESLSNAEESKLNDERSKFLLAFEKSHFSNKIKFDLSQYVLTDRPGGEIDIHSILLKLYKRAMLE
jgi:hypothetical protein